MTMESLKVRVGRIVERDWKALGQALLEDRKASGKGDVRVFSLVCVLSNSVVYV